MLEQIRTTQCQGSVGLVVKHGVRATNAGMGLGQIHRNLQNRPQADSKKRGPAYQDGYQWLKNVQNPDHVPAVEQRGLGL